MLEEIQSLSTASALTDSTFGILEVVILPSPDPDLFIIIPPVIVR